MLIQRRQTVVAAILFLVLSCGPCVSPAATPSSSLRGRLLAGYLLVVPVSLNGRGPWDFVVDTGTNQTIVDPAIAAELHLSTNGRVMLGSLAGQQGVLLASVNSISVGSSVVEKLEVLVGGVDTMRTLDSRIRGVLALDFLYHFAFSLDFEDARLRLFPPNALKAKDDSAAVSVNIQLIDGRLLVPSHWPDSTERLLALDSGIASVVLFEDRETPSFARDTGQVQRKLLTNAASTDAIEVLIPEFAIGQHRFCELHGLLLTRTSEMKDLHEDGLLPASLFRSVFVNLHARIATFKKR
jgi:Aspartyl protease